MASECPYCGETDCTVEWHPTAWIEGEMSKPVTPDHVLVAKVALQASLGSPSWLRGIGISKDAKGQHCIRVNVASKENVLAVPTTWNGIPVDIMVIGAIRPLKP